MKKAVAGSWRQPSSAPSAWRPRSTSRVVRAASGGTAARRARGAARARHPHQLARERQRCALNCSSCGGGYAYGATSGASATRPGTTDGTPAAATLPAAAAAAARRRRGAPAPPRARAAAPRPVRGRRRRAERQVVAQAEFAVHALPAVVGARVFECGAAEWHQPAAGCAGRSPMAGSSSSGCNSVQRSPGASDTSSCDVGSYACVARPSMWILVRLCALFHLVLHSTQVRVTRESTRRVATRALADDRPPCATSPSPQHSSQRHRHTAFTPNGQLPDSHSVARQRPDADVPMGTIATGVRSLLASSRHPQRSRARAFRPASTACCSRRSKPSRSASSWSTTQDR